MENNKNIKITYTKNLNKLNFNSTINIPINSNANIKTILHISTYLFDQKVECGNGKAIITGKIGLKALYIDTDNITNTLTESVNFSETYLDNSITSDCYLNISNATIVNNILSSDSSLKVNCDINIVPIVYLNLGFNNNLPSNNSLISRKSEVKTKVMSNTINTNFEYTTNFETKDKINKILCHNSYFTPEKTTPIDNGAFVEGKLLSCLIYETTHNEETVIKNLTDTFTVKVDLSANGINKDSWLDLSYQLDKNKEEITTDFEDENSVVMVKHFVKVCGVELKDVSIDLIDDAYSTDNEIEISKSNREYTKTSEHYNISEIVSNEISLADNETAIDDVIANLNIVPEITNTYIKDNNLMLEGIITSNLTYIDENKEYKQKQTELPFIVNTKIMLESLGCVKTDVSIVDTKVKVKRGTIIELEYSLYCSISVYEKENCEMVDNYTVGKPLNFSKYDFQIFLAKPGETLWNLCKRIKIAPEEISKYNKELPLIMQGGEKIIIKR